MSRPHLVPEIRFPHIYVHLPFCESICHYCDFYVARTKEADQSALFVALERHLDRYAAYLPTKIATIYFGGGTPSESPPALIAHFLKRFREKISKETEVTLEANPTSIDSEKIAAWADAGITRVSVGVQSLSDEHLKRLSRLHKATEALDSIETVAKKIPNVSADLIYGVPGMRDEEAARDARTLVHAGAKHVSAYTLTLGKNHFLYAKLPDDETTLRQSEAVRDALREQGLEAYEASNYAKPEFESRHNQAYWSSRPYLALGPSAHGYDGENLRWQNVPDWQKYAEKIASGTEPFHEWETLSPEEKREEVLITRLRSRRGLSRHESPSLLGPEWFKNKASIFNGLESSGLGAWVGDCWIPSFHGLMLADEIALKLV